MPNAFTQVKKSKRSDDTCNAQHGGNTQHHPHIPSFGLARITDAVIGNRQYGAIVQQCQQHDHHRSYGVEVENQDRKRHKQEHPDRLRNAVDRVAGHALENLAALFYGVDDHG